MKNSAKGFYSPGTPLPIRSSHLRFSIGPTSETSKIPGILVKISLICSCLTLRIYFLFLVLVSKHKIDRMIFSILSRNTRFKERYSRSRLKKWDFDSNFLRKIIHYLKKIREINTNTTERQKFSFLS